jgi:hypothetical protein
VLVVRSNIGAAKYQPITLTLYRFSIASVIEYAMVFGGI